jgi:LPS-assembly lipoprotein
MVRSLSKAHIPDKARRHLATLAAAGVVMLVSGCGFHLRGEVDVPFKNVYIQSAATSQFGTELRRVFERSNTVELTDAASHAEVVVQILDEQQVQEILSISSAGSVNEYQLLYRVSYRITNNQMDEMAPSDEIRVRRDLTFDDTQTLGKESEVQLLFRDMREDAVQQLMRRLSVVTTSA